MGKYVRKGSIWKMMKNIYKDKNMSIGKGTYELMSNFGELQIIDIINDACDVCVSENKTIVTEDHFKVAMEKKGFDISKYK